MALTNGKYRHAQFKMADEYFLTMETIVEEMDKGTYDNSFKDANVLAFCHKLSERAKTNDLFKYLEDNSERLAWNTLIKSYYDNDVCVVETVSRDGSRKFECLHIDNDEGRLNSLVELVQDVDLVIGNPRGSLFADVYQIVQDSGIEFILWGIMSKIINQNLNYDYKRGLWHYGNTYNKPMPHYKGDTDEIKNMNTTSVFTNCDVKVNHKLIKAKKKMQQLIESGKLYKFDNLDMFNIDICENLPCDYPIGELLALPISCVPKMDETMWKYRGIVNSFACPNEEKGRFCGEEQLVVKNGKVTKTRIGCKDGKAVFTRCVFERIS